MLRFSKNVFLQEKIVKENQEYFEIFWILRKWNLQNLINHLANMCQSCPGTTTVTIFVFWGQKSKVSQPKIKKGKNVSMVCCLISGVM
jgi:hypothetical protein